MKLRTIGSAWVRASFVTAIAALLPNPAGATGTALIAHPDGSQSTYHNVRIVIWNESMALTSSDGKGTVVLGKAACTKVDELVKCIPYDATLYQNGYGVHIPLVSGTVWLNPSQTVQNLQDSSAQLPPHGVMLAVKTKRGTYVTLTGTVDEVHR